MQVRAVLLVLAAASIWPAGRLEASCVYVGPLCQTWKNHAAIFGADPHIDRVATGQQIWLGTWQVGHPLPGVKMRVPNYQLPTANVSV